MKDIEITLSDAFRYFLTGGIFLVLLVIVYPDLLGLQILHSEENSTNSNFFTVILGISLPFLIGSTLYVFHRMVIYSLLYRIISFFINWFFKPGDLPLLDPGKPDKLLLIPWLTITRSAFKYDYSRWYLENPVIKDSEKKEPKLMGIPDCSTNLKLWASQTHFMYCIGLILLILLLLSVKFQPDHALCKLFFLKWWMILLVYIMALLSQIRYMVFEYRLAMLWKRLP